MAYRPKFTITPRLSARMAEIEVRREAFPSSKGWIASSRDFNSRRRKAEAQPYTLERVIALANGEDFPVVTESREREVLGYFATRHRSESQSGKGCWTPKHLLQLHKVVTAGEGMDQGLAGEYRSTAVRRGKSVPPPPDEVPRLTLELLEWWNSKTRNLPAVLTSAVLHYRISDIHPFADGNGRVARALALWELYRNGFGRNVALFLNGHYWGQRHRYYAALRAVSRHGEDLTGWLEYSAGRLKQELERQHRFS